MGEKPLSQECFHEKTRWCGLRTSWRPWNGAGSAAAVVQQFEPGCQDSGNPRETPTKGQDSSYSRAGGPPQLTSRSRKTPHPEQAAGGLPNSRGRPAQDGPPLSRPNIGRPQPVRGWPGLDPRGLPGLIQPAGPMDAMQRLALMMAVMILGAPQIYGCHVSGDLKMRGI
jgi:hypothetical protein